MHLSRWAFRQFPTASKKFPAAKSSDNSTMRCFYTNPVIHDPLAHARYEPDPCQRSRSTLREMTAFSVVRR
jgi:hypothetical protein